jgi:hypothetical protein
LLLVRITTQALRDSEFVPKTIVGNCSAMHPAQNSTALQKIQVSSHGFDRNVQFSGGSVGINAPVSLSPLK